MALTFDVFDTVVDWRTSVIREGQMLSEEKGFEVNWEEFADRWRGGYGPSMNRVRTGELPWTKIDVLHRMTLDELIVEFGLTGLSEEETDQFNRVWHRLIPWPDTLRGLHRLRSQYLIITLSNGNFSLLTNMAENAGLPWDCILSSELARHYKRYPEVYETPGLTPWRVRLPLPEFISGQALTETAEETESPSGEPASDRVYYPTE